MQRAPYILIGALVLVIVGSLVWFSVLNKIPEGTTDTQATNPPVINSIETAIVYNCEEGKTAFDLLLEKYPDTKFEESSLGRLVTSINGKEQGNGKYWLYSIDNKEATIGATQYICQDKETINWNLK